MVAFYHTTLTLATNNTEHHTTQLTPLEFRSVSESALEGNENESPVIVGTSCTTTAEAIREHGGIYGSIAFVVRRPGKICSYTTIHTLPSTLTIYELF
jgi:hypothetical protein